MKCKSTKTFSCKVIQMSSNTRSMSRISLARIPHSPSSRIEPKSFRIGSMTIFCSGNEDNIPCEILLAVLNSWAQISIGATNALVIFFAVKHMDYHALLSCVGYNFFMIEGILSLNFTNSWSVYISLGKRRFVHMFLQFCAVASITTGTMVPIYEQKDLGNPHAMLAIMALACSVLTFFVGPFALFGSQRWKIFHITFAIPSVFLAYLCLVFGLLGQNFKEFVSPGVTFVVIAVAFYFIAYFVLMTFTKCLLRIKYSPGDIN